MTTTTVLHSAVDDLDSNSLFQCQDLLTKDTYSRAYTTKVGRDWKLVRSLKPGATAFHSATDNLAGTDIYCQPEGAPDCICENGTPDPLGCPNTKSTTSLYKCESCDDGFKNDGTSCIKERPCKCANGTPEAGGCSSNEGDKCQSCNIGSSPDKLDGSTCVKERVCRCPNGTPDPNGCTGMTAPYLCVIGSCKQGFVPAVEKNIFTIITI